MPNCIRKLNPSEILIPGNTKTGQSYLYAVDLDSEKRREGCEFTYGVMAWMWWWWRRLLQWAVEREEEALGGVSDVGGSIHRASPCRLHPLLSLPL